MSDLRKLIASIDSLNEAAATPVATAKTVIAEGSMLRALNMVTKSVAPAAEMAKEYKKFVAEAAQGHTIEAHGIRGMSRKPWHKSFKNEDQLMAWADKYDAEILGTRDLEQSVQGNLSPAITDEGIGSKIAAGALAGAMALAPTPATAHGLYYKTEMGREQKEREKQEVADKIAQRKDTDASVDAEQRKNYHKHPAVKTEAEGDAEGMKHITKELLTHIVQQIGKEGAHAVIKSLEWGDGAAEELLQLIRQDLEKHISLDESVKQRLDKSCWAGYKKQGTKIKGGVKVNNCVKESYGVFSRVSEGAAIKTFALKEDAMAMAKRYNKLNREEGIKYVVRNIAESFPIAAATGVMTRSLPGNANKSKPYITKSKSEATPKFTAKMQARHDATVGKKKTDEAMAPAIATASAKMNPGAAAPVAATASPTSPASSAPQAPGIKTAPVDPKVAQAKKAAIQNNLQKLKIPGANVGQIAGSMEKADDMSMPLSATDNANNAKIATSLSGVLQNPQAVQQLKTLTDKYKTQPGQ